MFVCTSRRHRHSFLTLLLLGCTMFLARGTSAAPSMAAAQQRAHQLLGLFARGEFVEASRFFDTRMAQAMTPSRLQQLWAMLQAQAGPYQSHHIVRQRRIGPYVSITLSSQFRRKRALIRLMFNRSRQLSGLVLLRWVAKPGHVATRPTQRPAHPQPPYINTTKFRERPVVIGSGSWRLPGTLAMPYSKTAVPAVVLVHGSGPFDRDGSIGPNKPYRNIAQGLASQGIAVLRYDKRSRHYARRMRLLQPYTTLQELTVADAVVATQLLQTTPGVDPRRVFVLGHSLGGMALPRIAHFLPHVAGYVHLASPSRHFADLLLAQYRYLLIFDSKLSRLERGQLKLLREQVAFAKSRKLTVKSPARLLPFGLSAAFWLDLQNYYPLSVVQRISKPMLFLQGLRDYQVTTTDLAGWKRALRDRQDVSFRTYPSLNHFFIAGTGKSSAQEYRLRGHVAYRVIKDLATWLKEQPARPTTTPKRRSSTRPSSPPSTTPSSAP